MLQPDGMTSLPPMCQPKKAVQCWSIRTVSPAWLPSGDGSLHDQQHVSRLLVYAAADAMPLAGKTTGSLVAVPPAAVTASSQLHNAKCSCHVKCAASWATLSSLNWPLLCCNNMLLCTTLLHAFHHHAHDDQSGPETYSGGHAMHQIVLRRALTK